jgi:hypothetical protein
VVALVADVALAAAPVISIPHVPLAPEPVKEGTPRFVRASAAEDAPVPPSATARSVMPVIDPPEIETEFAACVAIEPSPKLVLAVEAEAKSERLFDR